MMQWMKASEVARELAVSTSYAYILHDKKCLNGVQIVIRSDPIAQGGKCLVHGVCRDIADIAPDDIADAKAQNLFEVLLYDKPFRTIVMRLQQKRIPQPQIQQSRISKQL